MDLDFNNPYHGPAYLLLSFFCADCSASLLSEDSEDHGSYEWTERFARRAYEAGWFVPDPHALVLDPSEGLPVWCPECGARRGLMRQPYASVPRLTRRSIERLLAASGPVCGAGSRPEPSLSLHPLDLPT